LRGGALGQAKSRVSLRPGREFFLFWASPLAGEKIFCPALYFTAPPRMPPVKGALYKIFFFCFWVKLIGRKKFCYVLRFATALDRGIGVGPSERKGGVAG